MSTFKMPVIRHKEISDNQSINQSIKGMAKCDKGQKAGMSSNSRKDDENRFFAALPPLVPRSFFRCG